MSGRLLIFVGIALLVGCKAPAPDVNPLAGYGSPRVPPPPTGAARDPYFNGSAANSNSGAAVQPGSPNYATANATSSPSFAAPPAGGTLNWRGAGNNSGNANFSGSLNSAPTNPGGPSGPLDSGATNGSIPANNSSLRLKSMAVNDALSAPPAPVDVRGNVVNQATPAVYQGFTQPAATAPTTPTTPTVPSLFNPTTQAAPLRWGN